VRLSDGSEATVKADLIFINTGSDPQFQDPGIETVDAKRVLDSTSIQELDEIPEHLLVIGEAM